MNDILSGVMAMGYIVAGLFFLRFWKRSDDKLFLYFTVAFWLLAGQRMALSLSGRESEHGLWFYIVRLFAFLLILAAIVDKNRERKKHGAS
jgi:hypothetical protein